MGRAKGKKLSGLSVWKKKGQTHRELANRDLDKGYPAKQPHPLYVVILQFGHRNLANRCQLLLSIVGIQFEFLHQTHEISFNAGTCR